MFTQKFAIKKQHWNFVSVQSEPPYVFFFWYIYSFKVNRFHVRRELSF